MWVDTGISGIRAWNRCAACDYSHSGQMREMGNSKSQAYLPLSSGRWTMSGRPENTKLQPMQLNPDTKLSSLLRAIPSAASVCDALQIQIPGSEDKSLERVCSEADVTFASFLKALDNIDWDKEWN